MEILDLLDNLENTILSGKQPIYISKKQVLISKEDVISQLDTIRNLLNEKYQVLKYKLSEIEMGENENRNQVIKRAMPYEIIESNSQAKDIVQQAKNQALEIKEEIDEYADKVLENLKVTVIKFKRKLLNLDGVLDMSRDRIKKTAYYTNIEDDFPELTLNHKKKEL